MISTPQKNILHVDDDHYLEHGEGEQSSLDIVMNTKHYTPKMRTIVFQVQEHGFQHGEYNIFSNGLILFLPSITQIHTKSLMQVSQRYIENANNTQTTKFHDSQEYTTQLMKLKYRIVATWVLMLKRSPTRTFFNMWY
jgi:hypothetical protein